jgi:hypothetical protein
VTLLLRRISSAASRTWLWAHHWRWILLSLVLAAVGLLSIWFPPPAVVNLSLAVVSFAFLISELARFRSSSSQLRFIPWLDDFDDVEQALADNSRFEIVRFSNGTFLADHVATVEIGAGRVQVSVDHAPFQVPVRLKEIGGEYRRRATAGRIDVWNGPVLGLDSNLGADRDLPVDEVVLRSGRYFDHLSTDLLAMNEVQAHGRYRDDLGRALVIDRHSLPRDFGDSWLLNALGTQIIALTTDQRAIVVHQTAKNESSKNQQAPSGSGSVEPVDAPDGRSLRDIAVAGALREMGQEAGITEDDVVDTEFLGFGRWLDKAGKPELFCVARLSIDSHEAEQRVANPEDRPFSMFAEPRRLARPHTSWRTDALGDIFDDQRPTAMSVPLQVCLWLMARAASDETHPAHRIVRYPST